MIVTPTLLLLWIVCGLAAYWIADRKGYTNGVGWFVTGMLFGPLAILIALAMGSPGDEETPPPGGGSGGGDETGGEARR